MSELLGRRPQYTFVDEWEPPDHKWSFDSEYADWDEFFENYSVELFTLLFFFGIPTFRVLFETNLIEKFWYRVNVQNSITRNVLLLCEPRKELEHNYYKEYIDRLPLLGQKALTSQIPENIEKYRKELDDACRKKQTRRNPSIRDNGRF